MKKFAIFGVLVVVALGILGFAAYRLGWLAVAVPSLAGPAKQPGATMAPGTPAAPAPDAGGTPGATPALGQAAAAPAKFDGNVANLEWGGKIEAVTGTTPDDDRVIQAIDGDPNTIWNAENDGKPSEIVLSFFDGQPILVDSVVVVSNVDPTPKDAARDVEVWTSVTSATEGFAKVASASLPPEAEGRVSFQPVEARFLKLRLLKNQEGQPAFQIVDIRVMEAQRPGYTSIVGRRPDIAGPPPAGALPAAAAASAQACVPQDAPPLQPGNGESRKVLVITENPGQEPRDAYDGFRLKQREPAVKNAGTADFSIVDRAQMTAARSYWARPYMLSEGYDTLVLEQVCEDTRKMTASFKQAILPWVAAGHKLIIHDADKCATGPDYSWLPYKLKTNNPGAQGAQGSFLRLVEENWMVHGRKGRPGFIDTQAWEESADDYSNELGDSNTVTEWDPHWCGHMVVRNVNNVFGFVQAYAHYGRGLIIYGGFDIDMKDTRGYDVLIARELAQGFNPDNLPCSARFGDFVVTTDTQLVERPLVAGRTYPYPLTLLPNQGYKGTVNLSLSSSPAVEGLQYKFDPASVAVSDLTKTALTLTMPAALKQSAVAVEVKGADTNGRTNTLCLQFVPPRTGELAVTSALERPQKARKNLEIILDASGSMKTAMGKKSRWDTALATLRQVVDKLPDDFNVGLRIYGHREASRSPRTCTDSEIVVPIEKLDRDAIVTAAKAVKPKGETPLVYSVLQAPADLKAVGGGTVILITDGEESCGGDPLKAAAQVKASGLDVTLHVVGFAVTNAKVQKELAGFAEATGGRFYAAQSGTALGEALLVAAIESFPYTVYDAAGKQVAEGEAGGPSQELPPGDYKVVVKAGAQEVVAPRVHVALGQMAGVRIVFRNGQLMLDQ